MAFQYNIYLDTARDYTFALGIDNITNYVEDMTWFSGLQDTWGNVAPRAVLTLTLNNHSGDLSQTDPSATYYDLLRYGSLVKVTVYYDSTETTLCVLKIDKITVLPHVSYGAEFQYRITCSDPVPAFLNATSEVPLLEDIRVDEALDSVFDTNPFVYPYDSAWFFIGVDSIGGTEEIYDYTAENLTSFEEAYSTLPFVGDNLDRGHGVNINQYIRDLMQTEYTGIFFWDVRTEQFKFYNRYHNKIASVNPYVARTSSATFTMEHISRIQYETVNVINELTVEYYPRSVGAAQSVLSEKRGLPVVARANEEKEYVLRFYDPDDNSAQVGGRDVIIPVLGLDIIGNRQSDGGGADWTNFIKVKSVQVFADRAIVRLFINKVGDPVYITTFQIRGTPIKSFQREQVQVTNADSRYRYDRRYRSDTTRLIATDERATEYATFWVNVFSEDDHNLASITITAKQDSPDFIKTQVINRTIGDVITIENQYQVTADYLIIGEQHLAKLIEGIHEATWRLRPIANYTPFIIDESEIGSRHLIVI